MSAERPAAKRDPRRTRAGRALLYFGLVSDPRERDGLDTKTSWAYGVGFFVAFILWNLGIDELDLRFWPAVAASVVFGVLLMTAIVAGQQLTARRKARQRAASNEPVAGGDDEPGT